MNDSRKNVLLCGLGAIGTIYAEKFINCSSINFKVVVDEQRYERYKKNKIFYNGKELNFEFIKPNNNSFKADLIIIATKYGNLPEAINEIRNFIKTDTIILPLQNGITSEDIVAKSYGWDHVLYAYFIGHSAMRENYKISHDGKNKIVFGSTIKNDKKLTEVCKIFDTANINYEIPEDIIHSLWAKFMLNVASNPTTALFKVTFGELRSNPKILNFAKNIMEEVYSVAKAEGIKNADKLIESCMTNIMQMSSDGKTSMLQDIENGRKTENDIFTGTITKLSKKHNINTPYCNILTEIFNILDSKI